MERTHVRKEVERSETRTADGRPVQNQILNSIPESEFILISSNLEFVELPHRLILHEAGERILFAYFLNQGMASLVVLFTPTVFITSALWGQFDSIYVSLSAGCHQIVISSTRN